MTVERPSPVLATSAMAGTAWMGAAALVGAATGFGSAALLTRHWGPFRYGQYAALVAWATIAAVLAEGGLAQALSKESAHHPSAMGSLYAAAVRRRVALSAGVLAGVCGVLWLADQATPSVLALAAVVATWQLDLGLDLSLTIWRVLGRYRDAALWRLARRLAYLAAVALGVGLGLGVTGIALATLLAAVPFALAASGVVARREAKHRAPGARLPRNTTGLFWAAGVLYWVYFQADQLLLAALADHEQLGLYAPAVAVAAVLLLLTTVMAEVVLPRFFHLAAAEPGSYTEIGRRALRQVPAFALLAGLTALVFTFFSASITDVVFGARFARTAPLLALLGIFVAMRYLAVPAFLAIQAVDRLHYLVAVQAVAAVVNVVGNVVLIPDRGARGAALATLVSEGVMLAGVWGFLPHQWSRRAAPLAAPFVALSGLALLGAAAAGDAMPVRVGAVAGYLVVGGWLAYRLSTADRR